MKYENEVKHTKALACIVNKKLVKYLNKNKEYSFPAVYKNIVDPVGCGDAFFAISSIVFRFTKDPILSNFLGPGAVQLAKFTATLQSLFL